MENTELELYIQIRDGQPYEHPIFADNFREAFPDIDTDDLPKTFAKFVRVAPPAIDTFEVYEGVTYAWDNGAVKDVHHVRPMTDEERAVKIVQLEDGANYARDNRIAFIKDILAGELSDAARKLWLDCLAAHEAWVLESVEPLMPMFPLFPHQDEDGNWMAP